MPLIYLVRHAQASFGTHDYDRLSELGQQQAAWLGEHFRARQLRFARVVAGQLRRQRQTAQTVLETLGASVPIGTDPGLDEYPGSELYAAFTGGVDPVEHQRRDYRDYWRTFRAAMAAWSEDALQGVPETWAAFGARVGGALEASVAGLARDEAVLVVSSGGAIGRALSEVLRSPASVAIELNLQYRNTGVTELLAAGSGGLRLLGFNAVSHLERPDRRHALTFA
jgi:broad specificity phosphatase PhoE